MLSLDQDYGQSLENDYTYAKNSIGTSNIFLNLKNIMLIILQTSFSWAILYLLKAIFVSFPVEQERNENNYNSEQEKSKLRKFLEEKISM